MYYPPLTPSGIGFIIVNVYTQKRGVQLVFTLIKGFAIPVLGRKTTDIHARYANPPPHTLQARTEYIHIHEDIHRCCSDLKLNFAKILMSRKQRQ